MSTTYTLSPLAYLKPILHAAKYPSSTTCGLLVGRVEGSSVQIEDAVPLLHHWTELSPMMEAGLGMAEIYIKSQSQQILGLYVANEQLENTTVPPALSKVADALRREYKEAIVLVLDNLALGTTEPAYIPYLPSGTILKPTTFSSSSSITLSDPTIITKAIQHVGAGRHQVLGDFDEHLEDVKVDWLKNADVVL